MSTNSPICWALLLCACSRSPSEGQLKSWLDETHREEQARRAKGGAAEATSWTLAVRGKVRPRLPNKTNPKLATGAVEVQAEELQILNRCPTPPFEVMSVRATPTSTSS